MKKDRQARRQSRLTRARVLVAAQVDWIARHGGDLAGYLERYAGVGDGGYRIYEADVACLVRLEAELARLEAREVTIAR